MTRLMMAISIAALALAAGDAIAASKGKSGDAPAWSGSNPPGFSTEGNRTGWQGNTQPPGWTKGQTNHPGWSNSGGVPPGLNKKGSK